MSNTPYIAIFVLDDSIDDLEFIKRELNKNAIVNYMMFTDADRFMEALQENTFSILIIDHNLGSTKNGLQVMIEAIKKNKQLFTILLTASDDKILLAEYMNRGANRWVVKGKPGDWEELIGFIHEGFKYFEELFYALNQLSDL